MATSLVDDPTEPKPHPKMVLSNPIPEQYQSILARLPWPGDGASHLLRTFGLTSCHSGEGVSTTAVFLAMEAARIGDQRVLLVDANFAHPSVHEATGVDLSPGLSESLLDLQRLPAAIQPSSLENLYVLSAGGDGGNGAQAGASASSSDLLEALKADFDLVVFDLPAAGVAGFPFRLSALLDGIIWVVEAERVSGKVAQQVKELLTCARVRLLGAVLNKAPRHGPRWLDQTS
jgi:Mrp family chromosome partitioning ATPase